LCAAISGSSRVSAERSSSLDSCWVRPGPSSDLQAPFARTLRDGGDAAVVLVATAVEHDRGDAGVQGPARDELADLAGLGRLVAGVGAQVRLHRRRADQRVALVVVDDLDEHVPVGAGHDQARPLGRAEDLLPDPQMPAPALQRATARGLSGQGLGACHDYLPAFPTLRRTYSPSYRTPLPLYGSGRRSLRMFAATSPTFCLSMPSTTSWVGFSTLNVMPSGGSTVIGWL